jgi:hypothetical protein
MTTQQVKGNPVRVLASHWQRWTGLVAACAARRAVGGVTAETYLKLHHEVVDACRAAAAAVEGADQEFYQELEGLVLPWVRLDVLARTDREILSHLLLRCREAQRRLKGRKERPKSKWSLSADAAFCIGVLLVVVAATFVLDWWPEWLTGRIERQARAAWNAWRVLGSTQQTLILLAVVALLAIPLLGRLTRKK